MPRHTIKIGLYKAEGGQDSFFRKLSLRSLGFDVESIDGQQKLVISQIEMHALELSKLEKGAEAEIALHYLDGDGDKIIILTDQDILEAFLESPCIKVFADVSCDTAETPTQTQETQTPQDSVVDAIADVLTSAAEATTAGVMVATRVSKSKAKDVKKISKEQIKAVKEISKESKQHIKKVARASKQQIKAAAKLSKEQLKQARNTVKSMAPVTVPLPKKTPTPVAREAPKPAPQRKEAPTPARVAEVPRATPAPAVSPSSSRVSSTADREFIHGRHTCDQCLVTPIIGKRFHAKNLPDYDLCAGCHNNYKGKGIVFEEAQLERDEAPQDRWHRKYHVMTRRRSRVLGRRGVHGPRGSHGPPFLGPPPFHGPPPSHGPLPPHGPTPPPPFAPHPPPPVDLALEEAIRRSLKENKKGEEAFLEKTVEPKCDETLAANMLDVQTVATEIDDSEEEIVVESVVEEAVESVVEEVESVVEEAVESVVEEAVESMEKTIDCAAAVEDEDDIAIESEKESEDKSGIDLSAAMDLDDSIAIESKKEPEDKCGALESSPQSKHESFLSDATGELETFVGKTLDRMGEAIENLKSETSEGATIVDGEDDCDEASDSQESWSVVKDGDAGLAMAAQALGSALFNSQVEASDEISEVTSVPTEIQSVVSNVGTAQLARWKLQLEKLHELGFMNDARNVDVLEKLSAANIGVGNDEEVTVQQVIDEIAKGW